MSRSTRQNSARLATRSKAKTLLKNPLKKASKTFASDSAEMSGDRGLTAFGERLVATLQSKGMSDSELAKALGIAQPNIHTLKYKTDRPRHKTVVKIAKALGVSAEVLLPQSPAFGAMAAAADGTKVYIVIETKQGRQTIRLA